MYQEAYRQFLEYLEARNYSPATIHAYYYDGRMIGRYLEEEGVPLDPKEWEPRHFVRLPLYFRAHGLSARTAQRKVDSFRSFCRFLLRFDILDQDPSRRIDRPKHRRRLPPWLTQTEMSRLLQAADRAEGMFQVRDRAIIYFLCYTGCRRSEVLGARWDQVNFRSGTIKVLGKGRKERIIPLHPRLSEVLWEYLQSRLPLRKQALFLNRIGNPLHADALRRVLRKYAYRAGMDRPITPHQVRHGFATLLAAGNPIQVVREVMGHEDIATTAIYLHTTEDERTQAVDGLAF